MKWLEILKKKKGKIKVFWFEEKWGNMAFVGEMGELKVGVGGEDPGPVLPKVVQAVCLQEDDGRSRGHGWDKAALRRSGVLTVFPDPRTALRTLRPHTHLLTSNSPTQRSLQANHRLRGQKYS